MMIMFKFQLNQSNFIFSEIISETPIFTKIKIAWIGLKWKVSYNYDPLAIQARVKVRFMKLISY